MTKKEKLKFIDQLYCSLMRANTQSPRADWQRYLDQIKQSERDHRKWAPRGTRFGLSVTDAVKLFAVQYIMEFRAGKFTYTGKHGYVFEHWPRRYNVSGIFSFRLELYYAQALWTHDKEAIRKAISRSDARKFIAEIDYCELING